MTPGVSKRIKAKFASKCMRCRGPVAAGSTVIWTPRVGVVCLTCPGKTPEAEEVDGDAAFEAREDAEYAKGIAEGKTYTDDRKFFGDELAERFAMDRELAAYNRGDDY